MTVLQVSALLVRDYIWNGHQLLSFFLQAPKLGPAADFESEIDEFVDVNQLLTDVESGQFSVDPSQIQLVTTASAESQPYQSPVWLAAFVADILCQQHRNPIPAPCIVDVGDTLTVSI